MNSSTYPAAQHVMVLYTGGTIGMQASANGLAPASGFEARMREYLHSQPELVVPQWRFREMSPLIDSANMTPAYWQQLREAVVDAVDVQGCDSVLILHGTDTLAYSAAAMSFQLLGLHARVCFTGSMLPAGVTDSDAWENLSGALVALGQGLAPGVHLYFHGELLDPTRCAKVRSFGRHPFKRLTRQGGGMKATSIPAALHYDQPKQLANVAVLPLFPASAPGLSTGCSTAVSRVWCWSATAAAPGRATIPSSSPALAARGITAWWWSRSRSAMKAGSSWMCMKPAVVCAALACYPAAA